MEFAVALTRRIAASRAKVYRAFLDPELLQRWMCPPEFTIAYATVDERVGGRHRVELLGPDGRRRTFDSVIEELVPDERIVMTFHFDRDGENTLLTITFRDAEDGATEIRLEHERITPVPPFDEQSVDAGWSHALANLQALYDKE
jgi:uncharacterized protein YndB with AHSA1/START domain